MTGYNLLAQGTDDPEAPSVLAETLLGALGALAVLLFVFASFLAFVPLLIAAVSILTTFLIVLLGTYVTDVSFVVQFLIALVGLGVAIDYSLLVVTRWREERAHGRDNDEAVVVAMETAGHAVVACGVHGGDQPARAGRRCRCRSCAAWASAACSSRWSASRSCSPCCRRCSASIGPRVDWPRIRHEDKAVAGLDRLGPADRPPALARRRRRAGHPRRC